jgi:hypothetical protein
MDHHMCKYMYLFNTKIIIHLKTFVRNTTSFNVTKELKNEGIAHVSTYLRDSKSFIALTSSA